MRLLEFFNMLSESEFLIERDVLNAQELKTWAREAAERVQSPQARTWFSSQLAKYLINRYDEQGALIPIREVPAGAPEWLATKIQQGGEPVFQVQVSQTLQGQAAGVIDWLNAGYAQNPKMQIRATWEEAVEEQDEWHKEAARASRVTELTPEEMEGLVDVREYKDGFKWVDVQTEVCLKHEGTMMGHCVGQGGYTADVLGNKTKIISLRDSKGLAHVTVEGKAPEDQPIKINPGGAGQYDLFTQKVESDLANMEINQIKGKENKAPVPKYRSYVKDFLNWAGVTSFTSYGYNDLERMGLYLTQDDRYVELLEIAEPSITMSDGTQWVMLDNTKIKTDDDSKIRWYLVDRKGKNIGAIFQAKEGKVRHISVPFEALHNEKKKKVPYRNHVKEFFNQTGIQPEQDYAGDNPLYLYDLALGRDGKVGSPNEVGMKLSKSTSSGDLYQTAEPGFWLWVMDSNRIVSHVTIAENKDKPGNIVMSFDKHFGMPEESMSKFLNEFEAAVGKAIGTVVMPHGVQIAASALRAQPGDFGLKELFKVKNEGITFYEHAGDENAGHYEAYDQFGNYLFEIDVEDKIIKFGVVPTKSIGGYYMIYLLNYLATDGDGEQASSGDMESLIGVYSKYDSLARDFLDETDWFNDYHGDWYIMDDDFEINYHVIQWTPDGEEGFDERTESTMSAFWQETSLEGSGMEHDWFADQYERLYGGHEIEWDDERETEAGESYQVNHYAEPTGDPDKRKHPVNDGEWRPQ
jgi:hypothetical protein